MMLGDPKLKPMGLGTSLVLFGIPAIVFIIVTRIVMPYFKATFSVHPLLVWFTLGGLFLFVPLFVLSIVLYKMDRYDLTMTAFTTRFRLTKLDRQDWFWIISSLCIIFALMGLIVFAWKLVSSQFGIAPLDTSPSFLEFEPLRGVETLLLLIWLPFFFFNIVGEELMWRGYILPRQELAFGKFAWLINALLWTIFHLFFGFQMLILLVPSLFIIPYVVYRRQKTLVGIVIHALLNGPSFIFISLGLLR